MTHKLAAQLCARCGYDSPKHVHGIFKDTAFLIKDGARFEIMEGVLIARRGEFCGRMSVEDFPPLLIDYLIDFIFPYYL